jgi:hypothetical protein
MEPLLNNRKTSQTSKHLVIIIIQNNWTIFGLVIDWVCDAENPYQEAIDKIEFV